MKEELLTKVFNWVSETSQAIGDWTAKEVPEFIKEFLVWKFWENAFGIFWYFVLFSFFISAWALIHKYVNKRVWKDYLEIKESRTRFGYTWDDNGSLVFAIIINIIISIVLLVAIPVSFPREEIKNCIQIKVAPKVFLIEEAARIVNSQRNLNTQQQR